LVNRLTITQQGALFNSTATMSNHELPDLSGSLFELWQSSYDLIRLGDEWPVFDPVALSFSCDAYYAEWLSLAGGYIIRFANGSTATTRLIGGRLVQSMAAYDDELSSRQEFLVYDFTTQINELLDHFGKRVLNQ